MKPFKVGRDIKRLSQIAELAVKHGFGFIIERYGLLELLPRHKRKEVFPPLPSEIVAQRFRHFLEDLGPTFVKVGQLLSVRPDLVTPDIVFELEKLQDTVEPISFDVTKDVVQSELKKTIKDVFSYFDPKPLASASIGQVHRATLKDGKIDVAVKVQRPTAKGTIDADLDLLFALAHTFREKVTFVDIVAVLQEFADSLHRELDYRVEGRHIDRFRHNFREDELVKIPLVFWKHTTQRVLVMEFVEGTKISDLATPEAVGIDTYVLAIHGAQAFMKQVLEDGFFHGDLHPANILVTPDAKIGYLDFGIVGQVTEEDRETIASMLIGIIKQDAEAIVRGAEKLGVHIPEDKLSMMRDDLKDIIDRYYGRRLGEIQIDIIGREFLDLIYSYHLRIPKDFALLAKALITIEGVAKQLYPQINIIEVARPYVLDLMKRKYSPERALEDIYDELKVYAGYILDYPKQLHTILTQLKAGDMQIRFRHIGLEELIFKLDRVTNRLVIGLIASVLLLCAIPLIALGFASPWLSWTLLAVALILVFWVILGVVRSKGL